MPDNTTSIKCIFLDRDGVLNVERGDYTFELEDFKIVPGVPEALNKLEKAGYLLIVITNQAGIAKGIYNIEDMKSCHAYLNKETNHLIDAIYFCPYHPSQTSSLARKPDSLMFEKAIARFNINPALSWMVGDKERDLIPAKKLGIKTVLVSESRQGIAADLYAKNLLEAANKVLGFDL